MEYGRYIAEMIPLLLDGLLVTVSICALATILAIFLAVVLVVARRSGSKWLGAMAAGYVTLMRGLPIVILIFLLYFGLPALLGLGRLSAYAIGVAALAMNGGAFISEVLRAAISRVSGGQREAAESLGLGRVQIWRFILIPQFLPIAIPALVGEVGFLVKASPVLSLITVVDLTRRSQQIAMQTFDPLGPLIAAALLYFGLLTSLSLMSRRLEARLQPQAVLR